MSNSIGSCRKLASPLNAECKRFACILNTSCEISYRLIWDKGGIVHCWISQQ